MQVALAAVSVPMMLIMAFVYESPRYSLIKGDLEATEISLRKIAKGNGKNPNIVQIGDQLAEEVMKNSTAGSYGKKYTALDLFKHGKPMALITLNCMFNWLVNSITYYGLSLNSASLPTDLYTSNLISAMIEMPAYLFATFAVDWKVLGRKYSLAGCLLLGGVCTLLSTVFNEIAFCEKDSEDRFKNGWIVTGFVCSLLGKMAVSSSFAIIYNLTAELFPTQVRANAIGICSMTSRIGG